MPALAGCEKQDGIFHQEALVRGTIARPASQREDIKAFDVREDLSLAQTR